ncbi:phosphoribosylformylglycinamidine cyclo-ligase [Thermosynechococcaceae cyanobacterium BACA0444]|uniref:Phosphoribosylformylglycinamidine cyclo-ligase n=1 Tax=Pseudocalidococcus azoricus BACA0444 TaxID=2918990 RepID=A0AAE4FUU3_9CYAN|nr:phosphoribosylformylglycinamidine cyclo-ligase [Pseudocalidococcus azoricus]MDS3861456.1 phosphoribosylformylglycinamidine cyclo-ligase [Pseudocalidococcus azoricus BACA0444]
MDYREAGVDVQAGRDFVQQIRGLVAKTQRPEVLGGLGGFAGYFELPSGYQQPVLVSGTDGVGTKLKIAQAMGQHQTIGIDLVAMCVNDVLTSGAKPLFFLDYLATGKLDPQALVDVVAGIARACEEVGCALLGGETAEMPGFYAPGEYDLAGFCVGIVEKARLSIEVNLGDVVIGLASSGVHSNGFSLVRRIMETKGWAWTDQVLELGKKSLGEIFLTPTQLYVAPVQAALQAGLEIHGMAHITGGGLPENLPRCLGSDQSIAIESGAWAVPELFDWLQFQGEVSPAAMYETFNMGIGYCLIVPPAEAQAAQAFFQVQGLRSDIIGSVISGNGELLGLPT